MYWSVTSAKQMDDYRLELTFQDGRTGVVDFEKYIRQDGVFKRLTSHKAFRQWRINPDFGTICWGDDLDIAPETLYEEATTSSRVAGVAESRAPYGRRRGKTQPIKKV